jgi:dihydrofolate synthase/folylpolyglutamate synthase
MDFESALEYLERFVNYERMVDFEYGEGDFDLERFREVVREYGIDYGEVKFVHVAGSKGKGSVCNFVAEYLRRCGGDGDGVFKIGLFTSPHLVDIRERIRVNGKMIGKERFAEYVARLRKFFERRKKHPRGDFFSKKITYFEALTLIALKFFVDEGVDYAVLEVGLGGRLDSTNIVVPELSILTRVEMEHVGILGENLEEILEEKLGIVKEGVPLLVGPQSEEVMDLIKRKLERKVDVYFVEDFNCSFLDDYEKDNSYYDKARIENAKIAFCSFKILLSWVDKDIFKEVFENFKLPGRFDVREIDGKVVVFDVAHTKNSTRNLIDSLVKFFSAEKFVFLVGMLRGKDVEGILRMIREVAERVVFTSVRGGRGYSGKELAKLFEKVEFNQKIKIAEDSVLAYKSAFEELKEGEILIVTGSHYLVGGLLSACFEAD